MKKLLLLLVPVLMLACSKDYTEDINTINGRLDKLEQESIPSVNEQLELLKTAVSTLKEVDKDLEQLIDDLEKTSGTHTTEINSLKEKDKVLDTRVKELESTADSLEEDVKSLKSKATETLSQLKATNDSLSALSSQVSTLGTNLGNLDKKIDEAVASLDNKINFAIEQLNSKIADLESRLKAVEGKVSELLARIQSVSYIPEYTDGKVLVERMGQTSSGSFSFRISPKDCVSALANVWESALSCEAVYTKTRAVSLAKLAVTEFEGDEENGIITVKFSGEGLSEEFFAGQQEASVALVISDGNSSLTSEYVDMFAHVITDEIWYTTTDGNVLEPKNVGVDIFGANIVSNTYENGKGVILFNAPVTSIGEWAFSDCRSLKSITIPDSVTSIKGGAFSNCSSLQAFCGKYASSDNRCLVADGVLISFAPSGLTSYTIPNSVTSIGGYALYHCIRLTSITIPNSVTSIGNNAFDDCRSLTSIIIPDSVTSIGEGAFRDCSSLQAFYGKYASSDNRCLVADGVLVSFAPSGLTSYIIPNSVTSIEYCAFYGCSSLTSVTIPDSVTSIGDGAFYECSSLTSITIPDSVTSIGSHAFYGCSSLTSVTIPDRVTSIGDYTFSYCRSLTSVTIPDSVTSIGEWAFNYCDSLTSVTIPDSVTSIGKGAFASCRSLTSVYCKPTTPPEGDSHMFYYNVSGRKIYVPRNSVEAYESARYWSSYASDIVGYDF